MIDDYYIILLGMQAQSVRMWVRVCIHANVYAYVCACACVYACAFAYGGLNSPITQLIGASSLGVYH